MPIPSFTALSAQRHLIRDARPDPCSKAAPGPGLFFFRALSPPAPEGIYLYLPVRLYPYLYLHLYLQLFLHLCLYAYLPGILAM